MIIHEETSNIECYSMSLTLVYKLTAFSSYFGDIRDLLLLNQYACVNHCRLGWKTDPKCAERASSHQSVSAVSHEGIRTDGWLVSAIGLRGVCPDEQRWWRWAATIEKKFSAVVGEERFLHTSKQTNKQATSCLLLIPTASNLLCLICSRRDLVFLDL
jgi:hypothetical protein